MHFKKTQFVALLLETVVGGLLVYSSIVHFKNPYFLFDAVLNYGLLNEAFSRHFTICLAYLEFLLGACLLLKWFGAVPHVLCSALFAVFILAQLYVVAKGKEIGCGCFGDHVETVGISTIARTVALLMTTLLSLVLRKWNRVAGFWRKAKQ